MIATDIERLENEFLAGNAPEQLGDRLTDMFTGNRAPGGNVLLTLSKAAQDAAYKELSNNKVGAKKGAVVALDPQTGAVLAHGLDAELRPEPAGRATTPTRPAKRTPRWRHNPAGPLTNRATSEILPPGSTFKVIVSAAALESGITPSSRIPALVRPTPPLAGPVRHPERGLQHLPGVADHPAAGADCLVQHRVRPARR